MKKRIISIDINQGNKDFYENKIIDLIDRKVNSYVCFSNVHMLVEAHNDKEFAKVVNEATFAFPDGFPIAKSFKFLHKINQPRIAGMDFLPNFLEVCQTKKYRIAVIGSTEDVLNKFKHKIEEEYPNIAVTALISPPFGKAWNNEQYIIELNTTKTDAIFVALGCPKQEKWMHNHYKQINAMLFGIGGALPTYVGDVKRAPVLIQKYGFEWLYRLIQEPRRMAKRYFYTNSKFLFLFLKTWMLKK
ncbi:WecB/TagA/CpsF family glycosyltransferase [uncultured Algibacter sp.]|uniref:WecB/TagA/CpsF family glycosyltransferase n=1 Tax=uncultured Algibacter sp. TaxID=298659 RepID=UPI0030EB33AC|tara:strand:- start:1284 stop:2018 length:735 start_codon:yes stop_codon:yes gene_type:complete